MIKESPCTLLLYMLGQFVVFFYNMMQHANIFASQLQRTQLRVYECQNKFV